MKRWIFLIAGTVLFVLAGGYFWCYWQTVCIVNSRLEIAGRRYVLNRREMGKFIRTNMQGKNVRQVYLYRKDEEAGLYKRVKSGNRPLLLEIKTGRGEMKILEVQGEKSLSVAMENRQEGVFNYLTILMDGEIDDNLSEGLVSRALGAILRWYVGASGQQDMGYFGLVQEAKI